MTKYATGQRLYKELKAEFLSGETVRDIALTRGMDAAEVLDFLRWVSREFDIERAIRTDAVLSTLMKTLEKLAAHMQAAATLGEIPRVQALRNEIAALRAEFTALSLANEEYVDKKRSRPRGGRPSKRNSELEIEGEDDSPPEPQGGLEAQVLPARSRR